MSRLIIVSNRLPVTVTKRGGSIKLQSSVGGLASGLDAFHSTHKSLWIGWPGYISARTAQDTASIRKALKKKNCHPVFLSAYDVEHYYHGFCNKTLWPLFHYFMQYVAYDNRAWRAYERVNQQFCDVICSIARPGDTVWVHDYQLLLLPHLLRKKMPKASIGFFLHIPFPSSEVFRLLPCRNDIIEGMLGADLIGFHTYDYVHHFTESVRRLAGYDYSLGYIYSNRTRINVDAFPMGIDYERFQHAVQTPAAEREIARIQERFKNRKIIVSIDRLDYTKGIPERLEAFDLFLSQHPEFRKKVTLILIAVPSRTNVVHYVRLKKRVDELISQINGKYGDIGYMPIWYLYRMLPFEKLVPLYVVGDVALVTPLRDGMNLIAKEYIASKIDQHGVLILGEMAGAARELGEALIVNPNNCDELAATIYEALSMPEEDQQRRNRIMQRRLKRYNIDRWARDFMDRLQRIKQIQSSIRVCAITNRILQSIVDDYQKSVRRLILLDYDGTLIPFKDDPDEARPTNEIIRILRALARDERNETVIVSGRRRGTLDVWFGAIDVSLIAEHGIWLKSRKTHWTLIGSLDDRWKTQIKPILEIFADRTPGSFIEEKEYSLVWHYRRSDPKLARIRAGELKETIRQLTSNLDLGVLEGSKVIEIKNLGINKGRAVAKWLQKKQWDFIMAIGDDYTDEDIFRVLPKNALSIKVGLGLSEAKYTIQSPDQVGRLLKRFIALPVSR
jgi:trehalose 6-phosphate synthase/phosphatase